MNTEITENVKGWLFYDAECALCRGWAGRWHDRLVERGFHPVPLQAVWAKARLGLSDTGPLTEMRLLTPEGKIYGGADALVRITRSLWWAWPFWVVAQIPGVKPLLRIGYRWLAERRGRFGCGSESGRAKQPRHITSAFYELP
ncbi:MAG TPA: DUF393 domain-containing protein [Verrucomicrobiae bacterium]|nr:DUF393 domain-containing protein [Verrucomicrobiae bacterium]